jgi:hypothetical protein
MKTNNEKSKVIAEYLNIKVEDFFKRNNKKLESVICGDTVLFRRFQAWAYNKFKCNSWAKVYQTGKTTAWVFYEFIESEGKDE